MTYLKSIENFRAIAIIVIVAGHALNFSNFPNSLFFQNFFYNFFTGGTFYFVFISGVLFHHVFYINFNYKNFIKGKIKNVFLPYLILSIIFLTYIIFTYQDNIFNTEQNSLFFESAFFIIKKLLLGDHVMGYWYIPFIMSIFIFSHIFIRYIKLNNVNKFMILFVLLINSILMMRPNTSSFLSLIQSVLYFFPVYIIGILYSENRHKINSLIFKKEKILLFFSIFFLIFHIFLGNNIDRSDDFFIFQGIDLLFFHKLLFVFFIISFFISRPDSKFSILGQVSANSFGIFFLHGLFLKAFNKFTNSLLIDFEISYFFTFPMIFLITFLTCFYTTEIFKKLLGNKSKYFIGS